MQISISNEMLAVTIQEDTNTFYFLQNLAEKNFQKKIGRKNKTIIFKENCELVQRRYFLKLLSKIYFRKTEDQNTTTLIQESIDKTIKISLLKSNQLQQQVSIKMKIEDNYAVVFHVGAHNSLLTSYFKNYFKDHLVQVRPKNNTITLYPNSKLTVDLIEKLLSQKEMLGCFVTFTYDKEELHSYKKSLMHKRTRRSHHNALFSLLEEYFCILGCKIEDSFETIRSNYLKLVKKYHPDSYVQDTHALHVNYVQKFQEIQYAYEMIKMHYRNEKIKIA